jgi:hypothetical protein
MEGRKPTGRPHTQGRRIARAAASGAAAAFTIALLATPALADDSTAPLNAVSSTGGTAVAEGSSSVQTGDIVTGYNTGHVVETGGTSNGDLTVSVDEMSTDADLAVSAEIGPQIADASGGDYGEASTSPGPQPPEFNVHIRNTHHTNNDNRSEATGIGEGGQGGEGGSGGNVTIGDGETGGGGG